jgi:hypothetical protein
MKTTYIEFKAALNIVNNYKKQTEKHYKEVEKQYKKINRFAGVTKETKIRDIDSVGVRTLNCLSSLKDWDFLNNETKVKEFKNVTIRELKLLRNFGNKGLQEVKEICFYAGVTLLP